MKCEIANLRPHRDGVMIPDCANEATIEILTRGWDGGNKRVCGECDRKYFSPKYGRLPLLESDR